MRKRQLSFCLAGLLAIAGLLQALPAQAGCNDRSLENLPVLADGRVKPLVVHASEILRTILESSPKGSATEAYCKLSMHEAYDVNLRIDHVELRRKLELPAGAKTIAIAAVQARELDLTSELERLRAEQKDKTSYGKALNNLLFRLQRYQAIDFGSDWTVPVRSTGAEGDWVSLTEFRNSQSLNTIDEALAQIKQRGEAYLKSTPSTVRMELVYHHLNLITYKVLAAILGLVIVFAVQNKAPKTRFAVGTTIAVLIMGLTVVDLYFRIRISGRGPVTNMYETVLWVGLGVLLFSTILAWLKNQSVYFLFGLFGMLLTVFMNRFAPSMVDPKIHPLVPVLRDNFWLSTHVTTVTISYAAFALSWLIANHFMLKTIFKGYDAKLATQLNDLAYAAIKIGVVLLAAGIILGGVWADYSWGRFWGWDPKETWALVALLIYVGVLHGRYAGWISPKNFLPVVGVCFLSVLMCWFGVNYILASGLHSYGFSEHGAVFLSSLVALQLAVFGLHWMKIKAQA